MEYLALLFSIVKNPALDIMVILFFLAAGFFWGMMGGRAKLLSFLLGTYLALFTTPLIFELFDEYKVPQHPYRNLAIYIGLFALMFIFCERVFFRVMGRASFKWWQALAISFLSVGIFVAGALNMISFKNIMPLSPITLSLFAGPTAYLFWAIAPLVGLVIFSRR